MRLSYGRSPKIRVGTQRLQREVGRSISSLLQASESQLMLICPKKHQLRFYQSMRKDAQVAGSFCQALKIPQ